MCYLLLILTLEYNPLHATGLELLLGVADGAQRRLSYVNMVMGKLISLPLAHGYVHCVLYPPVMYAEKVTDGLKDSCSSLVSTLFFALAYICCGHSWDSFAGT